MFTKFKIEYLIFQDSHLRHHVMQFDVNFAKQQINYRNWSVAHLYQRLLCHLFLKCLTRRSSIENLKHCKMLDPLGQAWQNGNALAA